MFGWEIELKMTALKHTRIESWKKPIKYRQAAPTGPGRLYLSLISFLILIEICTISFFPLRYCCRRASFRIITSD